MRKIEIKARFWNIFDEEKIQRGEKQPIELEAIIDTGALSPVVPEKLAEDLKLLRMKEKTKVKYADGREAMKEVAVGLRIEVMGRNAETKAIIEPNRDKPLIGMLALEDWDLYIDPKNGSLIPRPESPDMPMYDLL